jgi:hypothetical protein
MKFLIYASNLLCVFLILSCSEQGTNPTEQLKDPRDMTWTADTLVNPDPRTYQTLMSTMYASSPNNVYIAGHTDSRAQIWYYDGSKWKDIDLIDQFGGYSVSGVSGLSERSVWVYGYQGFSMTWGTLKKCFVIQNNGNKWIPHYLDGYGRIIRVGGDKENNIWAVGDSGIVFNYNGTIWKKDYVKVNAPVGSSYFLNGVVVMNNTTYLTAAIFDINQQREIFYFIKGAIGNWTIVDSMYLENPSSQIKFGNRGLYLSKEGELFSYGLFGIWKYNGTNWEQLINIDTDLIGVFSLKKNYTIAVGGLGYVFFYDGSSWTKLERFFRPQGGLNINDVWTNGKKVYLLANITDSWPMKTIIFKGK